jgi:hypothetical protein
MLPSKTIPEVNRKGHTRIPKVKAKLTAAPPKTKERAHSVETEETEDDNCSRNITMRNVSFNASNASISKSPTSSFQISNPKKVQYVHFYVVHNFASIRVLDGQEESNLLVL